MRRGPTCLMHLRLTLKKGYHEIHLVSWVLLCFYNTNRYSFLEESLWFPMKYCWFPHKYLLTIILQYIYWTINHAALQVEQHEYSLKPLKSVMSSDKFVALNTKHRHAHTKFICISQIFQIKNCPYNIDGEQN